MAHNLCYFHQNFLLPLQSMTNPEKVNIFGLIKSLSKKSSCQLALELLQLALMCNSWSNCLKTFSDHFLVDVEGIPCSTRVDVVSSWFCTSVIRQVAACNGGTRSSGKIAAAYFLKWSPLKHWHQVEGLSSQGGTQGERRHGESYRKCACVCVCAIRREREREVNGCCSDVSVFS